MLESITPLWAMTQRVRCLQQETELGLMEAVVTKMSRIIAHVGSQNEQGQQILIQASI